MSGNGASERDDVVVRRAGRGWVVGEENVSDLTSAMVLADLFAADQADGDNPGSRPDAGDATPPSAGAAADLRPAEQARMANPPAAWAPATAAHPAAARAPATAAGLPGAAAMATVAEPPGERAEAERLAVTVTQLEHALASRVRVEQAIGILAERHRLRPREAFDLLRKASRSRGRRVTELAHDVVESAANPLLLLPDELARKAPEPRPRNRSPRRGRHAM